MRAYIIEVYRQSGYRNSTDGIQIQFWVKKHLLERWNDFCEEHSLSRTAFLTQAANLFMLDYNHKGGTLEGFYSNQRI
ncbi:MAG: hypothetical protein ACTSUE_08130 [Promethearchaeota archaeon]